MADETKDKTSAKTRVFKAIWEERKKPSGSVEPVSGNELTEAIRALKKKDPSVKLSDRNPANFLKDYLRSKKRNMLWDAEMTAARIGARQKYGEGQVFEFYKFDDPDGIPFPIDEAFNEEGLSADHIVETLSIPRAARGLATGKNEAALLQIVADQNVLARHFAVTGHPELATLDVRLLMQGMKGTPEIDALYLLTCGLGENERRSLVALEAKGDDPILEDQIRAQIVRLAKLCHPKSRYPEYKGLGIQSIIGAACRYGPEMKRDASIDAKGEKRLVIFDLKPWSISDAVGYEDRTYDLPIKRRDGGASAMRFVPPIGRLPKSSKAKKP